jgi:HB1/ASXL restriction endonuclease-like protein with HTH domain/restriction endonuclease
MTFTDAAAEVLRLVGKPLHYKEITDIAIEKNLLSHVGKSPEVTMGARLAATLKKDSSENPLVRVKPGVFALREWDEKTIKSGLEPKKAGKKGPSSRSEAPPTKEHAAKDDDDEVLIAGDEPEDEASAADDDAADEAFEAPLHDDDAVAAPVAAAPAASPSRAAAPRPAQDDGPPGPDEAMRNEAAAGAAEMFDEEEDDDQPILGGDDRAAAPGAGEVGADGRRRRRRRRRGRSNGDAAPVGPGAGGGVGAVTSGGGSGGLPSYTATPVSFEPRSDRGRERNNDRDQPRDRSNGERNGERSFDRGDDARRDGGESPHRGPQVIELTGGDGHALDDLAGRELSDAIAVILSTFDRNAGAVSLRQIAETAQRRGRLSGDAQLVQSQVAAAVRADNARRIASGSRPRFRLAGGRVALTDWLLSGDLARLEQEALAAVERYRDAARRAFARKLGELPGHAFVEICVLALEKIGIGQLRAVRRPGAPGGETHLSGILRAAGDEVRVAIVIRRDGREVGRERVTELRGSLHHYGPATVGWIFTAGQMLSGAREEAAMPGTPPIALYDGLAVARLCEDNDVAVIRARLPIAIPDVDLLEALRAS